jgi:hypothetical protein
MRAPMDFLYEDVRNARFALHSEKRSQAGQIVYVLQLLNAQTGAVAQEKLFYNWQEYSNWYRQMHLMLQFGP